MSVATPPRAAREAATPQAAEEGLAAAGGALLASLEQQARHVAELAAAEARLAALSGIGIVVCALLAVAALLVTWILVVVLAGGGLVALGLRWPLAVALLAAAHLLAAYALWRGVVNLSANLVFPRLRRVLLPTGPESPGERP